MIRHFPVNRRLIALLLPLIFVWSWIDCPAICTENAENHAQELRRNSILVENGDVFSQSHSRDECQFLPLPATVQERQTIAVRAFAVAEIMLPTQVQRVTLFTIPESDIRQNSPPPKLKVPIFLRLHNFRI